MKHRTGKICLAFMVAGALFAGFAVAQEGTKSKGGDPKMEEMMKKMEALGSTGPAHRKLEPLAGDWSVTSVSWCNGPEAPPIESKGTAKARWILGNRFLQEEFKGEFMNKPFNGIGTTGYDNVKKKYVSVWMDDMGTGLFTTEGTLDSGGKEFTFEGKMDDPMTGQKDKPMKLVIRVVNQDKHMFEMHDMTLGAKSKMMEMTYTRK